MKFRKKPTIISAIQYTGINAAELDEFTGGNFVKLDDADRAVCDDPAATAQVFDGLNSTWVLVFDGDWIIRDAEGRYFPCHPEVFAAEYEAVPG